MAPSNREPLGRAIQLLLIANGVAAACVAFQKVSRRQIAFWCSKEIGWIMSVVCTVVNSFEGLSEASRARLRTFLDTADNASPYQDPVFFGDRRLGEVDVVIERGGEPVFFALGIENFALGRFFRNLRTLVIHKGPVVHDEDALISGLRALKELGRKRGLCEIHINPQIYEGKAYDVAQTCGALGFRPLSSTSSEGTLRLNISSNIEEVFARFHQGTRYKVRRADRIGISVLRADSKADFSQFYELYSQRASEKGYDPLPTADFLALSERLRASPSRGAVFLSEYKGDLLYGGLFLRSGPRVQFIYGGTDVQKAGNLPAGYPVFRRAIEWAKEIGCSEFDFGGYTATGDPTVRRFKEGFGGELRTFVPAYTLTIRPVVIGVGKLVRVLRP